VWFRGDSPPRSREEKFLEQGKAEGNGIDKQQLAIIQKLIEVRNFWAKKVPNREAPMPIMFESTAWVRWNQFALDAEEYVAHHPRGEMILPSIKRMSFATMKAAIMFAMMDKREEANMQDVLNAIYFSLQWIEDLIIVVSGVAESAVARDLAAIENYVIDRGGIVTYASMLKWSVGQNMRKFDFMDNVATLVEMNVLDMVEDAKGKRSYQIV